MKPIYLFSNILKILSVKEYFFLYQTKMLSSYFKAMRKRNFLVFLWKLEWTWSMSPVIALVCTKFVHILLLNEVNFFQQTESYILFLNFFATLFNIIWNSNISIVFTFQIYFEYFWNLSAFFNQDKINMESHIKFAF